MLAASRVMGGGDHHDGKVRSLSSSGMARRLLQLDIRIPVTFDVYILPSGSLLHPSGPVLSGFMGTFAFGSFSSPGVVSSSA
jgi:hypothetical protein